MYVCMYVYICICMYVRMHVYVFVCICMCFHIENGQGRGGGGKIIRREKMVGEASVRWLYGGGGKGSACMQ